MFPLVLALSFLAADVPPEREQALKTAVGKFADAFVEGKLRKAYSLVEEESQEVFLEMGKVKFSKYEWKDVAWSNDFTRAKVTLTVDTEFKMSGAVVPVKRPFEMLWKWKDDEWLWSYEPPTQVATPFGSVTVDPTAPKPEIDLEEKIKQGMKPEELSNVLDVTQEIVFQRSQPKEAELVVKNGLQGFVKVTPIIPRIPGLKIDYSAKQVGSGQTVAFKLYWNPPPPDVKLVDTVNCVLEAEPVGGDQTFTLFFRD